MMSSGRQWSVCALEYRSRNVDYSAGWEAPVVLLALMDDAGTLRFLVNPDLESIVPADDLAYIQSLLSDFVERAKNAPEDLFKQISLLGVGPLVTKTVLIDSAVDESLSNLIRKFTPL